MTDYDEFILTESGFCLITPEEPPEIERELRQMVSIVPVSAPARRKERIGLYVVKHQYFPKEPQLVL